MERKCVLLQIFPWFFVIAGLIACFWLGISGLLNSEQTVFGYLYSIYFLALGVGLIIFMAGSNDIMDLFSAKIISIKQQETEIPGYLEKDRDLKKYW